MRRWINLAGGAPRHPANSLLIVIRVALMTNTRGVLVPDYFVDTIGVPCCSSNSLALSRQFSDRISLAVFRTRNPAETQSPEEV
jgi:hypothetical protein